MRKTACLLFVVFAAALVQKPLAVADPAPNRIEIRPVSDRVYRIEARVSRYAFRPPAIDCEMNGATRTDLEERAGFPEFVHLLEVDGGRSVAFDSIDSDRCERPLDGWTDLEQAPRQALTVDVARMGKRTFLRVGFCPFVPDPDTGRIAIYEKLNAVIRVLDTEADKRQVAPMGTSGSLGDPFCPECPARVPIGVSEGNGAPGDYAAHRSVTNDLAWKIRISGPGLYRVTDQVLSQAGVPAECRDASLLRISTRDRVVPTWRSSEGPMQPDDWLMFYGADVESAYATQNVYWLSIGDPSPEPTVTSAPPSGDWPVVTSAWTQVAYAPKNFYRAAYNPLDESYDHWFALSVYGGTTSNLPFSTPYPIRTGEVYLAYSIHGVNQYTPVNPDHRSRLAVGGVTAATHAYDGQAQVAGTASVPATAVSPGGTTVSLYQEVLSGVPHPEYAIAYIEFLRLHYQRALVANSTPFFFGGRTTQTTLRVSGVATTNFWLLDVSDPMQPVELSDYALQSEGSAWALSFGDRQGEGRCFALVCTSGVRTVGALEPVRFRPLADPSRRADYLVVAPDAFRLPVYRLLKHRYKNELAVQVATPEDLYNEFSFGVKDPVALRQYFGYAYHGYAPPAPTYALLVGAGSYDPLNRLGHGKTDYIPVRIGGAPFRRTALEQWYAMVDGADMLPDIRLGRIPASSIGAMSNAVRKLIAYETAASGAAWRTNALLAADNADASNNFKSFAETNTRPHLVRGGFDPLFGLQTAYLDDISSSQVRQTIRAYLNGGGQLVYYMGHGSVEQWASENVWNRTDTEACTNTVFPIFTVFTCQSGAFHDPESTCLAESIVVGPAAGSACFGPTALSVQLYANRLADGFYESLAVDRAARLGDVAEAAYLRLWTFNPSARELLFYTIFGDPAQAIWEQANP